MSSNAVVGSAPCGTQSTASSAAMFITGAQFERGEMSAAERSAFLNARTTDGKAALSIATISGCKQVVALLCCEGADVDAADRTLESTPLHWAGARLPLGKLALFAAGLRVAHGARSSVQLRHSAPYRLADSPAPHLCQSFRGRAVNARQ
jgi:hypothetical protein